MATAIEVEHLTKTFPGRVAVDDVSFSIEQGKIVGFLGPNGAGKTTTIRMLTCFLPATHGRAAVMGFDVFDQAIEVRRRIGYLPEATPVYPEMRVEEYLRYRARLKGVPRAKVTAAVEQAMERTGTVEARRRIVGHLSKGFRQRVGIADALVASPPILILDEPTIGLDPNQIRQTRELIRELGEDHTVFLSTHILPEVEQVCDRVVIIHKGRLSGEGTPAELRERVSQGVRLKVEVRWPQDVGRERARETIRGELERIEGVRAVTATGGAPGSGDDSYSFAVLASSDDQVRDRIFYAAVEADWILRELTVEAMSLEEVFAHITNAEDEERGEDDSEGGDGDEAGGEGGDGDEGKGVETSDEGEDGDEGGDDDEDGDGERQEG